MRASSCARFFFQAEDGIRDTSVTGVQTCALPISNMKLADPRPIVGGNERVVRPRLEDARFFYNQDRKIRLEARVPQLARVVYHHQLRSEERRVGKECRSLWAGEQSKKRKTMKKV